MKQLFIMIFLIFILPVQSFADILKFETNTWSYKRQLTWTCKLEQIDRKSGIAKFLYLNREKMVEFSVHISRIYSLVIDAQNRVDRELPKMRQNPTIPLPYDLNKPRIVCLSDSNFAKDFVPEDVRIKVTENTIKMPATILSVDHGKMTLFTRTKLKGMKEFIMDTKYFH